MPASADTVLRTVRRVPLPTHPTPRALGVDDWAVRKRCTYGTILVDLDAHRVVDLLPDRAAATLAAWLQAHPGVNVIARDRSTEYARGATVGAPEAAQVADRWHLLLNVRQMTERWLASVHGRLRALVPLLDPNATTPPAQRVGAFPRTRAEADASADSRARWRARYDDVRRRHHAGEPLLRIGRAMGLARSTVRRFAYAEIFPAHATHPRRPSMLDPYLAHLVTRHAAGCENALELWRAIRALGYAGTPRQVHRWLHERRLVPARTQSAARRREAAVRLVPTPTGGLPLPAPRQLAWLVGQAPPALAPTEAAAVAHIEQDAEARRVIALVRRFVEIVRARGVARGATPVASCEPFEQWLGAALTCGVRAVETFATGLAQDGAAVRAALTTPWSNAQSEGQITKLKLLKRQRYGRANFDLLRRRVLLGAPRGRPLRRRRATRRWPTRVPASRSSRTTRGAP